VLLLIAPYSGLHEIYINESYPDKSITVKLYVNNVLLFLSMHIRIYLTVRLSVILSKYTSPRQQRLCQVYGKEATFMFAIKCIMKVKPYSFLATSTIVPLFIGGYC
jgi:hypothetical protein